MAFTLVASVTATPGASGGSTAAIDTTGATLLVISCACYDPGGSPPVTDNKGNTWFPLTKRALGVTAVQQFYAKNPTVGSGHVFTFGPYSNAYIFVSVLAYSGADTTAPFDVENGATTAAAAPLTTGSITPSVNGALIVSAWSGMLGATGPTVGTGLTLRHWANPAGGNNLGGASADLIQTTAAAINPSWSWTGTDNVAVTVAAFKPLAGSTAQGRVSQLPLEVLHAPTIIEARVSQLPLEVLHSPTPEVTTVAQVSQVPLEVLHVGGVDQALALDVTQAVVEVSAQQPGVLAVTQLPLEIAWKAPSELHVTQLLIEIIRGKPKCPPANYPFLPACEADLYPVLPAVSADLFPFLPVEDCMDASTFVVNMALAEIGISKSILSLTGDTSQEAYAARLVFSDVMDTVLRDFPWKFATEYAVLPWVAGTVAVPVNPDWTYTYLLPADCVRVRRVCDPSMQRRYTTKPVPFDQRADPTTLRDLLMCNEPGGGQLPAPATGVDPTIQIEYTRRLACPAQVNDAQFREAVVFKLAARLAKALARDSKDADRCLRNYGLALPKAQTQHANDAEPQRPTSEPPDWTMGR